MIGDNDLLASHILIIDNQHGVYDGEVQSKPEESPNDRKITSKSIELGNNVWIGENVTILGGVTIGDNVIVGAGAVVNRSVPDNCMVVGAPAVIVKNGMNKTKSWKELKVREE